MDACGCGCSVSRPVIGAIEATLRSDGSVAAVTPPPAAARGADPGASRAIFPLDGLPGVEAGAPLPADPTASRASWTGGFSFAVWDRRQGTLGAYRDHYGARALYYHHGPGRLLLASGLPALLGRLPSEPLIDETSIVEYLATGAISENRTFYRGVLRVPAASMLSAGRGGLTV